MLPINPKAKTVLARADDRPNIGARLFFSDADVAAIIGSAKATD